MCALREQEGLLEVRRVTARYTGAPVLTGVSLSVEEGEVACLLGSNGAGKSTIVKTILGLVTPLSGEIRFAGRRIDGQPPSRAKHVGIGVVPEGKRLFPKMSVRENLLTGSKGTLRDAKARILELCELFPLLDERFHQPAGLLSGGEQTQVAMARALMSDPKLLILDEPSLGLSPILSKQMFRMVEQVHQGGTTVLLIEQNARQSLAVSNSGFVLQKGEIVASGPPSQLKSQESVKRAYLGGG